MIATTDQIHKCKAMAENQLAEDDDAAERLAKFHPECVTPVIFSGLLELLQSERQKKREILEGLIELCDSLLAER